jgi:hypothetical protein
VFPRSSTAAPEEVVTALIDLNGNESDAADNVSGRRRSGTFTKDDEGDDQDLETLVQKIEPSSSEQETVEDDDDDTSQATSLASSSQSTTSSAVTTDRDEATEDNIDVKEDHSKKVDAGNAPDLTEIKIENEVSELGDMSALSSIPSTPRTTVPQPSPPCDSLLGIGDSHPEQDPTLNEDLDSCFKLGKYFSGEITDVASRPDLFDQDVGRPISTQVKQQHRFLRDLRL